MAAAVFAGALLLMTPAWLVGHPDIFPDTSSYELIGQWLFEKAGFGVHSGFGYLRHRADLALFFSMAGARSWTYGLLMFVLAIWGSGWALIVVQALIGSALLAVAVRATAGHFSFRAFGGLLLLLTAGSSLPFFVSFLMPDVFAGYAALAAVVLVFFFDRLRGFERVALGLLLAASLSFHATNPLLALVIGGCGLLATRLRGVSWRPAAAGLSVLLGALMFSLATSAVYPPAVKALAHRGLHRPPFLTARLLADGPGRAYLRQACAVGQPYVICRYKDRPLTDANDILWHPGNKGVYEVSDLNTRLAILAEQPRFVRGVMAFDPLGAVSGLIGNSGLELVLVTVVDTLGYSGRLLSQAPAFDPPIHGASFCVRRPNYCHATPFQTGWDDLIIVGVMASVGYLLLRLGRTFGRRRLAAMLPMSAPMSAAVVSVLVAVLANGIICGALSGVYPRYQMRLIWILPLFAAVAWLEARRARRAAQTAG